MASPEARALVARLQGAGLSLAQIGRALDRDSGLLSQIARDARGAGYGGSLVPGLEALERRLSVTPGQLMAPEQARRGARIVAETRSIDVPRRRADGGRRVAAVRQGVKTAGPKDAALPGLYTKGGARSRGGNLSSVLDSAQQTGQLVYVSVTMSDGRRVGLGQRPAQEWRDRGLGLGGYVGDELDDCIESLVDDGEVGGYAGEGTVAAWSASMVAG